MDIWTSASGRIRAEILCADPGQMLAWLHQAGLEIFDISMPEPLLLRLKVSRRSYHRMCSLCEKRGAQCRILERIGIYWRMKALGARPILVFGILSLLIFGCWLPTRILFLSVEGNHQIPARLILETAADCGIRFGVSRREVRSEQMKNALLEALPQLQWAGINTSGCTAVICVRERETGETVSSSGGVSRITAARDGVVTAVTAIRGSALVQPGQAVQAGETLISGYTDCGLTIRAQRAQGEIYALTRRQLEAVIPAFGRTRGEKTGSQKKYGVIFGKKRINFYKDSGISQGSCVRIYEEKIVTLPGGFSLPLRFFVEEWVEYDTVSVQADVQEEESALREFSRDYLVSVMTAGQILEHNAIVTFDGSLIRLSGDYSCLEMIGQERSEEIENPIWTDRQNASSVPTG